MGDSRLHLIWCAGGIILSLMVYSVLQVRPLPSKHPGYVLTQPEVI